MVSGVTVRTRNQRGALGFSLSRGGKHAHGVASRLQWLGQSCDIKLPRFGVSTQGQLANSNGFLHGDRPEPASQDPVTVRR